MTEIENGASPPAPRGRPSKLNPALILALSGWLESGNDLETACGLVSISLATVVRWRREGRQLMEDQPDKSFEEWGAEGIFTPHLEQSCIGALARGQGSLGDMEARSASNIEYQFNLNQLSILRQKTWLAQKCGARV